MLEHICTVCGEKFYSPYFMANENLCGECAKKMWKKKLSKMPENRLAELEKYKKQLAKRKEYYRKKKLEKTK